MTDDKYRVVTRRELEDPPNGLYQVWKDAWWAVNADGNVFFYGATNSPQCNVHRSIAERVGMHAPGAVGVVQIHLAHVPVKLSDFA